MKTAFWIAALAFASACSLVTGCAAPDPATTNPNPLRLNEHYPYTGNRSEKARQAWQNWGRHLREDNVWIESNGFHRTYKAFPAIRDACQAYLDEHWEHWGGEDGFRLEYRTKHADLWVLIWRVRRDGGRAVTVFYDSELDRVVAVTMEDAR